MTKMLILAVGVVPLILSPQFSYDPVNLVKMSLTSIFAMIVFFLIFSEKANIRNRAYIRINISISLFLLWSLVSFFSHRGNLTQQFYGTFGRNTGLLTYLSFCILFIASVLWADIIYASRIIRTILTVGVLSVFYGILQVANMDPLNWISAYSPVVGFLGNPNFQSSLVAITAVAASTLLFSKQTKKARLFCILYILISIFIIYETKSQQGYLVFLFGFLVVLYMFIKTNENLKKFHIIYLIMMGLSGIYVILDILKLGIGNSILYKPSVSARGDFWRAAIEMMKKNPIFGVGFDSYGDNYRITRDNTAALRFEANIGSNSAHNIFLDIGSYGGIPLLTFYIILQIFVLIAIVRIVKRMRNYDFASVGIIACWIGYLAQSIISISQIGLAIWGWIFSGVIIGLDIKQSLAAEIISGQDRKILDKKQSKMRKNQTDSHLLAYAAGVVFGTIVCLPPFLADSNFRNALESRKVDRIVAAANRWPQDSVRFDAAYFVLRKEFPSQATEIARTAVQKIPMGYLGWKNLAEAPHASTSEKQVAEIKLRELDPLASIVSENLK